MRDCVSDVYISNIFYVLDCIDHCQNCTNDVDCRGCMEGYRPLLNEEDNIESCERKHYTLSTSIPS